MQSFTGKIYLADKGLQYYGIAVPNEVQSFFKEKNVKRVKVTIEEHYLDFSDYLSKR